MTNRGLVHPVNGKRGVMLSFYDGEFSLVGTYNGYVNFCRYQIGRDLYESEGRPMQVRFGSRDQTLIALRDLLNEVEKFGQK